MRKHISFAYVPFFLLHLNFFSLWLRHQRSTNKIRPDGAPSFTGNPVLLSIVKPFCNLSLPLSVQPYLRVLCVWWNTHTMTFFLLVHYGAFLFTCTYYNIANCLCYYTNQCSQFSLCCHLLSSTNSHSVLSAKKRCLHLGNLSCLWKLSVSSFPNDLRNMPCLFLTVRFCSNTQLVST